MGEKEGKRNRSGESRTGAIDQQMKENGLDGRRSLEEWNGKESVKNREKKPKHFGGFQLNGLKAN